MTGMTLLLIKMGVALGVVMGSVPIQVWMERRAAARFQRRIGPNRVGPFGLLQMIADSIKCAFKEDYFTKGTDRTMFLMAPVMTFLPGVVSFSLIAVGVAGDQVLGVTDIDMGLLVFLAISSLAAYGIAFAGWSANNQYSLLGGIRSSAQLISYEIIMGLSVVTLLLMTGSLNLREIVDQQAGLGWNILKQPITFFLFLIAAFAETNRAPFDLPEAEQELAGGYHLEYTGMRYAWFMLGEYAGLWTMSSIIVTLFLGGWHLPGLTGLEMGAVATGIVSAAVFMVKVLLVVFFFMWVRWTLPRMRWDQLMRLGWARLIPIALFNLVVTALLMEYFGLYGGN